MGVNLTDDAIDRSHRVGKKSATVDPRQTHLGEADSLPAQRGSDEGEESAEAD